MRTSETAVAHMIHLGWLRNITIRDSERFGSRKFYRKSRSAAARLSAPPSAAKPRFNANIRPEPALPQPTNRRKRLRAANERQRRAAGQLGRVEKDQLVHEARRQGRAVQRGAGFQKHTENFAPAQFAEDGFQVKHSTPRRQADDFHTGLQQLLRAGRFEPG